MFRSQKSYFCEDTEKRENDKEIRGECRQEIGRLLLSSQKHIQKHYLHNGTGNDSSTDYFALDSPSLAGIGCGGLVQIRQRPCHRSREPVGSVGIMFGDGLHSAEMQAGEAEIGYWIGVPYWGQGLIPEAVRCLLKRCFEDLGMTAVWCGYYEGNTKSRRVMEKCGFRFHHTEEGKTSPLGDVRTEHFMRMTKEEWINNKRT